MCEPAVLIARVRALETARKEAAETFDDLAIAFARANNLRDAELGSAVDDSLMGDTERALNAAISEAEQSVNEALAHDGYAQALQQLAALRKPIDAFFEDIMVMDENLDLRANRLKLLNRFVSVFSSVADFGLMAKASK